MLLLLLLLLVLPLHCLIRLRRSLGPALIGSCIGHIWTPDISWHDKRRSETWRQIIWPKQIVMISSSNKSPSNLIWITSLWWSIFYLNGRNLSCRSDETRQQISLRSDLTLMLRNKPPDLWRLLRQLLTWQILRLLFFISTIVIWSLVL